MMTPHRIGPAPASVTAVSLPCATRLIRAVAAVCLLLALLCSAASALAEQVEIELNNGTVVQGELVAESEQAVTLLRSGIREPYLRSDIKEIRTQRELTVDEQFDQRRAATADTDLLERYKLAAWGVNAKAYRKALAEIQAIRQAADGDTPPSLLTALDKLETVVNNRLQLEEPEAEDPTTGPGDTQTPEQRPERKELTWLTDEQVNLIRVYEVDLSDNPRVLVPNDVYDDLLENYRTNTIMEPFLQSDGRRRLRTLNDARFLRLLFDLRAREFYGKITIRTDPPALQDFRRIMYPNFVSSYFRRQFSSGEEPVLPLLFKRGNETNEVYTNFYILAQASHNGMPMIDRDRPQESLLLQWALPRDQALYPAPQVPGWRPFFNSTDDRLFRQYVSVISKLYQPKPDYGIDYAVPDVRVPQPDQPSQPEQPGTPAQDTATPEQ